MLEQGALSDAAILSLNYAVKSASMPSTVVVKYTKSVEASVEGAVAIGAYVKETNFYEYLAQHVPLNTPKVYAVVRDGDQPERFFFLVMEDLSVQWDALNQTVGISYEDQSNIVNVIADFNAAYFEPRLEYNVHNKEWLDDRGKAWFSGWYDQFVIDADTTFPILIAKSETRGVNIYGSGENIENSKKIVELLLPNRKVYVEHLYKQLALRPMTLIHGDLRCDNIFRNKQDPGTFSFIDWQGVALAPAGCEMMQLLCGSMAKLEDYERLPELLEQYYKRLIR
jgi:hypothetical protein